MLRSLRGIIPSSKLNLSVMTRLCLTQTKSLKSIASSKPEEKERLINAFGFAEMAVRAVV